MSDSFRIDARTMCGVAAATLACLLLLDIQSLHQTARQPMAQAGMSGRVQERVVTHEFNLVDDSGQTRVRLGMNDLNAPALSLNDQNGQERALLRLNQNDVPSLRLFDSSGTLRQGLGFTSGTLTPRLWFFDENGSTQQLIPGLNTNAVNRSSVSADYVGDVPSDVYWNGFTVRADSDNQLHWQQNVEEPRK